MAAGGLDVRELSLLGIRAMKHTLVAVDQHVAVSPEDEERAERAEDREHAVLPRREGTRLVRRNLLGNETGEDLCRHHRREGTSDSFTWPSAHAGMIGAYRAGATAVSLASAHGLRLRSVKRLVAAAGVWRNRLPA
jgi:hypothetical protein